MGGPYLLEMKILEYFEENEAHTLYVKTAIKLVRWDVDVHIQFTNQYLLWNINHVK